MVSSNKVVYNFEEGDGKNKKLLGGKGAGDLLRRCAAEREQGKKIVFTNGCFDILHRGHVHLLQEAKKSGDILVVALNSDRSAKAVKGASFPINGETDRAHLIAAIDAVDCITVFNENTPTGLIKRLRPDVIIKGGNYRRSEIAGRQYAGRTVIIPLLAGYSTREITRKICGKRA
jgi:D-beta-D-heptose 7-phosphate kinase/D-beta-D-heptose 1-phosphate adenosyltransferase